MNTRALSSACALACLCFGAASAEANIHPNENFVGMAQDGRDVSFELQLIDGETAVFDTPYKLVRADVDGPGETFFEHKQFSPEDADEVEGPGCIEVAEYDLVGDCDENGTPDCAGVCGTAYRYAFLDECVPVDHVMYTLWDESTFDEEGNPPATGPYSEGSWVMFDLQPTDDSCLDSGGCSVAAVSGRSSEAALAALMLLVGLGFAVVARRKKPR